MRIQANLVISGVDDVEVAARQFDRFQVLKTWRAGEKVSAKSARTQESNGVLVQLCKGDNTEEDVFLLDSALSVLSSNVNLFEAFKASHKSLDWQLSLSAEAGNGAYPSINLSKDDVSLLARLQLSFDFDIC